MTSPLTPIHTHEEIPAIPACFTCFPKPSGLVMSESRDHVLVKWKDDDKWDVYPIRNIKSVEKQCLIADDPRIIKEMACETVEVMWKDGEFAPAYILATGKNVNFFTISLHGV